MDNKKKKVYKKPRVQIHGNLKDITKGPKLSGTSEAKNLHIHR